MVITWRTYWVAIRRARKIELKDWNNFMVGGSQDKWEKSLHLRMALQFRQQEERYRHDSAH